MKAMSDKEMRELDAWIAEHAMGLSCIRAATFRPTTDYGATMEVLEKCVERLLNNVEIFGNNRDRFVVSGPNEAFESEAATLPLAICLFAKQLFSK